MVNASNNSTAAVKESFHLRLSLVETDINQLRERDIQREIQTNQLREIIGDLQLQINRLQPQVSHHKTKIPTISIRYQ